MIPRHFFIFLLCLFLLRVPVLCFSESSPKVSASYKGYNVILIILDALRQDHLSCYGYDKKTSPNIDELAEDGILFSNAFSQASYTLPSVASIFTSLYPSSHGATHILKDNVPDKIDTFAGILSAYGYNTSWFGFMDDPHSGNAKGLLKGFKQKFDLTQIERFTSDYNVVSGWIRENRQRPFFLTIHSYSVHEQTFPFRRFNNLISRLMPEGSLSFLDEIELKSWNKLQEIYKNNPEQINNILEKDWVENNKDYFIKPFSRQRIKDFNRLFQSPQQHEKRVKLDLITQREFWSLTMSLDKQQFLYFLSLLDSAIYEVDKDMVGMLVRELKKLNLYKNTIIIITADHGNEYREHGNLFHGTWLYDEVMRVPLIMYLPGFKKSAVIRELVQSIDILPTALDLLGIEPAHQAQGISLVGLMEGREKALRNEYVFCQGIPEGTVAIRSKDWKLFRKATESEKPQVMLFNLKKDPHELNNVINDKPQVAKQLESRLEAWQKGLVVYKEAQTEFAAEVDEATKERIKNTGYW